MTNSINAILDVNAILSILDVTDVPVKYVDGSEISRRLAVAAGSFELPTIEGWVDSYGWDPSEHADPSAFEAFLRDEAQGIIDTLAAVADALREGNLAEAAENLRLAQSLEWEHGDDPDVRQLREALREAIEEVPLKIEAVDFGDTGGDWWAKYDEDECRDELARQGSLAAWIEDELGALRAVDYDVHEDAELVRVEYLDADVLVRVVYRDGSVEVLGYGWEE